MIQTPRPLPKASIRNRRGVPGAPLLLFGEADVLAKAVGPPRPGLVLRKVPEKRGWWVFRWMRPDPKPAAPEPPPGSKAWLDKLNAAFVPAARPAADLAVLTLRTPKGKLTAAALKNAVTAVLDAAAKPNMPDIQRDYLESLWFDLFTQGVHEGLIQVKGPPPKELIRYAQRAESFGGGAHIGGTGLSAAEGEAEALAASSAARMDAYEARHAPPPDHPVEIDPQHMVRHSQLTNGERHGGYGMQFEAREGQPRRIGVQSEVLSPGRPKKSKTRSKAPSKERPKKYMSPQERRVARQRRYAQESGGRHGSLPTRHQNEGLAQYAERRDFTVVGGAGRGPEEWIPGPGGGRKGSRYVDVTAKRGNQTLRIQTVTTEKDGVTPTADEIAKAADINARFPNDLLVLVPKQKRDEAKYPVVEKRKRSSRVAKRKRSGRVAKRKGSRRR